MKTLEELKTTIKEIVKNEEIETIIIDNLYLLDSNTDPDGFIESIEESINEQDIVYYSRAMNYLLDNDASLQKSLQLASEYGYKLENLNSETLATLLYQDDLRENLSDLHKDIIEVIDEYNESQGE